MKTAILILAAGSSSRMGTPKQTLPYKETTLLGWAIEQAKNSKADSVFCVLGANAEIIKESIFNYKIQTLFNPNFKNGLSSSIVTGIHHLSTKNFDSVLIMLADQPSVNSEYLNNLIKTSINNPSKITASNYQNKMGVPAIFPRNYFPKLSNLKEDRGAKTLLNENQSEIIKMEPFNLNDIDTQEDYQNLKT